MEVTRIYSVAGILPSSKPLVRQMHLLARAYHRVLKLARTIADLAGSERIEAA
jgi:predicted ATPase with chaperone activity